MRLVFIPLDAPEPPALPAQLRLLQLSGSSMGCSWQVQFYLPASQPQQQAAFWQNGIQQELDLVVQQMSHWEAGSDLSRFNQAAAGSVCTLAPEFCTVMDYAIYLARQTEGAYDPAAGKLVNLWGFGPAENRHQPARRPSEADIAGVLAQPGWRDLQLNRLQRELLQPGGLSLDLSSIAKGFAVDQVAGFLERHAIPSYLVEVGGELRGYGIKPDQMPWWVRIETPPASAAYPTQTNWDGLVALHGLAIATSGSYRQFFEQDGRQYSHTLDPRSGYPVDNSLVSVTVLHKECMIADALATAFTVMGEQAALDYANSHQIACCLMSQSASGLQVQLSRTMQAMLDT